LISCLISAHVNLRTVVRATAKKTECAGPTPTP
jgi:hypothetical protein